MNNDKRTRELVHFILGAAMRGSPDKGAMKHALRRLNDLLGELLEFIYPEMGFDLTFDRHFEISEERLQIIYCLAHAIHNWVGPSRASNRAATVRSDRPIQLNLLLAAGADEPNSTSGSSEAERGDSSSGASVGDTAGP